MTLQSQSEEVLDFFFQGYGRLSQRGSQWPLSVSGILEVPAEPGPEALRGKDGVSLRQLRLQELWGLQGPNKATQRLPGVGIPRLQSTILLFHL